MSDHRLSSNPDHLPQDHPDPSSRVSLRTGSVGQGRSPVGGSGRSVGVVGDRDRDREKEMDTDRNGVRGSGDGDSARSLRWIHDKEDGDDVRSPSL